ncbi:hypothetical protein COCC4DRAFT_203565 [Bipolaris maydis ATCC 48331]|uniref:Uncharacterized protein n=2 Tax=Cochliobolus heterostrophus TaxID=5016 RepID=M2TB39_COCH5|nr:uncharacterized protein COCC4DRAFT_203565 [Bipolaris maydis ATCC 48331]EMD94780.1 hypothetical protein COCHEDRAFT_1167975 [Bipolaris maydis C5]KAJ5029197.1 hypothetical protein J3E73DRAFT_226723 [Bipolaris maydis]ENI01508.1 hypothetical protein COCC4DRAFT_203565 [Bipolaris maydis ATCC 48331]KAJ6215047.1 hypothetical protein PSV09DRAFT_1167975 [Bipolaris maydis]KAJ6276187.1 hypothetical protein PSV08DRAFT_358393 [Bipolaris maydis]
MDKIKNVLHGHKKDQGQDVTHDPHQPASTNETQQSPTHNETSSSRQGKHAPPGQPLYNIKTTSGAPYTELAKPGTLERLQGHKLHGKPEQIGANGPLDTDKAQSPVNNGTSPAGTFRPDAHPHGHTQEASIASIKSGVIGFGPTESQGHAAMSMHNPTKSNIAGDQVVGGGSPGAARVTQGKSVQPSAGAETHPQTSVVDNPPASTAVPSYADEQQPFENTLRQESYITDTNRSFPLAGGVTSNPQESSSHGSHGREGLAGAAATATVLGASHAISKSEENNVKHQGAEPRQATYGDGPSITASSTTVPPATTQMASDVSSQPESSHHPTGITAATAVASGSSLLTSSTQEKRLETDNNGTILPTTEPIGECERPIIPRLESRHRHIPGEYIATPSDESSLSLDYDPVIESTSSHADASEPVQAPSVVTVSNSEEHPVDPISTTGTHELRHTGTLEEPRPKSAGDNHHTRDAAIAGGLLAGTAGLGAHAASKDHKARDTESSSLLYEDSQPYSGKGLDPRVLGDKLKMEEQRFNPQAKAHYDSDPAISGPPVSHNLSRDTTLAGVGATRHGAQDAVDVYGSHKMTQLDASMPEQRYDPTASSARASNSIAPRSQYDYNNPTILSYVNRTDPNAHVNRNATFTGAGLAGVALGAGAYTREPHAHDAQDLSLRQNEEYASHTQGGPVSQPIYPTQDTSQTSWPLRDSPTYASDPTQGTIAPYNTHVQDPDIQSYGAVQDPVHEGHDTRNAALLGGAVGAAGLGSAAYAHDRHQDQDRRESNDYLKKTSLDHEKGQHHRDRDFDQENETEEKKKHRLLGFLHRDKSRKEKSSASPESSPRQSKDYSPRHSKEDSEDPDSPRWKGRHLLHKDPPKGHPAREVLEKSHHSNPYAVGKRQHVGTDGPIGDPYSISGDRETRHGVYGAHPTSDLTHNSTVLEPHTGLPMNAQQFGTGAGGVDGNRAIHGQHEHPGTTTGQSVTNWEAVRKANTPY